MTLNLPRKDNTASEAFPDTTERVWAPDGAGPGAYLHHGLGIQSEVEVTEDKVGHFLESLVNNPGRREGDGLLSASEPTDRLP